MFTRLKLRRILFSAFVCILILFLGYAWIDARISLDYARQEQEYQKKQIALLQQLVFELGTQTSLSQIAPIAANFKSSGHIVEQTSDQITIDDVVLRFDSGILTQVTYYNSTPDDKK